MAKHLSRQQFASLLHGPAYPALRKQLTPQQWQRLVREAHRRGTTVQGIASGLPAALTPMTRSGIRRQASRTVNSVYAPAEHDLDSQESRINAISEKRRIDNQHYSEWLATQQNTLRSQAQAADAALQKTMQDVNQSVVDTYAQAEQGARARAAAQAGNVSDPNKSLALDFSPERTRAIETVANQRQQSAQQINTGEQSSNFLTNANALYMAAQDAKRQADQFGALKDIGDERSKLRLSKVADKSKEIARLLDQEITKAQSNREFQAAAQKLGLDAAKFDFERGKFARQYALDKSKFRHQMSQDQIHNRLAEIKTQLESGRLDETQRHNLASERLRLLDIKTSGGKDSKKGKDTTAWRQYRGLIGKAKAYGAKPGRGSKIQRVLLLEDSNYDPLLVQAAVQIAINGSVDQHVAALIHKLYRFKVPTGSSGGGTLPKNGMY